MLFLFLQICKLSLREVTSPVKDGTETPVSVIPCLINENAQNAKHKFFLI